MAFIWVITTPGWVCGSRLRDPGGPVGLGEQKRPRDGTKFCSIPPPSLLFYQPVHVGPRFLWEWFIAYCSPPVYLFPLGGTTKSLTFESLKFPLSVGMSWFQSPSNKIKPASWGPFCYSFGKTKKQQNSINKNLKPNKPPKNVVRVGMKNMFLLFK